MDEQAVSMVMKQLDRIESKLDNVIRNGCSKADAHAELSHDVQQIKAWQQKAEGRLWGVSSTMSAIAGAASFLIGLWYKGK